MATMYYLFLTCGSLYLRVFFHTEEVFTLLLLLLLLLSLKLNQGSEFNMRSIHSLQASPAETSFMPLAAEDSRVGWRPATGSLNTSDLFCHHVYCIHSVLIWVCVAVFKNARKTEVRKIIFVTYSDSKSVTVSFNSPY